MGKYFIDRTHHNPNGLGGFDTHTTRTYYNTVNFDPRDYSPEVRHLSNELGKVLLFLVFLGFLGVILHDVYMGLGGSLHSVAFSLAVLFMLMAAPIVLVFGAPETGFGNLLRAFAAGGMLLAYVPGTMYTVYTWLPTRLTQEFVANFHTTWPAFLTNIGILVGTYAVLAFIAVRLVYRRRRRYA